MSPHQLLVLQRQVAKPTFTDTDRAILAGLLHHLPMPSATAKLHGTRYPEDSAVELRLVNDGDTEVSFTLTANDFGDETRTVQVKPRARTTTVRRSKHGRYDVTVIASTGTRFARRYAGTMHEV